MQKYKFWLKHISKNVHNKTTNTLELNAFKNIIPGFKGSFPFDVRPKLRNNESVILNLDKKNKPGSHWISIIKTNNKHYIYDSLGKYYKYSKPYKNSIFVDRDREQKYSEDNCGQRALAWILTVHSEGIEKALKI